ncbi:MAG: hypothetical protein C4521_05155 [Actinobacteria bacterium]|nr:MAG: hypothetical protein C4521_05155 [Actinomycetota bacterium]
MVVERLLEPRLAIALAVLLLLAAGLLSNSAGLDIGQAGGPRAAVRSGQVLAQMLGGVRSAAAAYIWIKLDTDHDTFYGDLRKEAPLIPLFRVATWLDPKMERAYYVGGYMLWQQGRLRESIEFASEGVANNPKSALLVFNLGQLYFLQEGRTAKEGALRHLWQAEEMTRKADIGLRLQVLTTLSATYAKWKIEGEPAWLDREIQSLRERIARERRQGQSGELEH